MRPFIEIKCKTRRVSVKLPFCFDAENITMRVTREGRRDPIAEYPSTYGESGQLDFLIDEDFTKAKPGWYIGVVRKCNKPIHTLRMYVPRAMLGEASTIETTEWDDSCKPKEVCPPECEPVQPCCHEPAHLQPCKETPCSKV